MGDPSEPRYYFCDDIIISEAPPQQRPMSRVVNPPTPPAVRLSRITTGAAQDAASVVEACVSPNFRTLSLIGMGGVCSSPRS